MVCLPINPVAIVPTVVATIVDVWTMAMIVYLWIGDRTGVNGRCRGASKMVSLMTLELERQNIQDAITQGLAPVAFFEVRCQTGLPVISFTLLYTPRSRTRRLN